MGQKYRETGWYRNRVTGTVFEFRPEQLGMRCVQDYSLIDYKSFDKEWEWPIGPGGLKAGDSQPPQEIAGKEPQEDK